ncbi:MAG TPA: putative Ig domain-containing protein [Steroidobacteraceae bacterium]|nr:putative Ig domain-containing protein [Steroidobacteraceae bacterium]
MLFSLVGTGRRVCVLFLGALAGWSCQQAVAQTFPDTLTNTAPQIDGVPPTSATVGQTYTFTPSAYDADGTPFFFAVIGNPPWLTLDSATGTLSGVPGPGDVGTLPGISLIVSDGYTVSMLDPFSITVVPADVPPVSVPPVVVPPVVPPVVTPPPPPVASSVALEWVAPTLNEDMSLLTDLAGFRIYYGPSPNVLNNVVDVATPDAMEFTVQNLTSGDWYFGITAYNSSGGESPLSVVVGASIP